MRVPRLQYGYSNVPLRDLRRHPSRSFQPSIVCLAADLTSIRAVFHKTALSFGIVNLKPLLPGRACRLRDQSCIDGIKLQDVLIIPRRVVPRLADLQTAEVADLFLAVQQVGTVIESAYKASALTISLQVSHPLWTGRSRFMSPT